MAEVTLNHNHVIYPNYILANEIEDQLASKLNLMQFATVDNSLVGVAGDTVKFHRYRATDGTEKLVMGQGNSKNIEVGFEPIEYKIELAQNRFPYYDEEAMNDPMVVPTGLRHTAVDLFNTQQRDLYAEFMKTTQTVNATTIDFNAFVDAVAMLPYEEIEGVEIFAICHPKDKAELRKTLKDDLSFVESYVRAGYVGHVAGVPVFAKMDATEGTMIIATRKAVTLFNKKGVEVEQERDANVRLNEVYTRKYYVAALTDEKEVVKIVKGGAVTP